MILFQPATELIVVELGKSGPSHDLIEVHCHINAVLSAAARHSSSQAWT